MTLNVLVTGGTGTLGRKVAAQLGDRGAIVRVLSRREHSAAGDISFVTGDLVAGTGVDTQSRASTRSSTARATGPAMPTRPGTWYGQPRRRPCRTWSTSRSSARTR